MRLHSLPLLAAALSLGGCHCGSPPPVGAPPTGPTGGSAPALAPPAAPPAGGPDATSLLNPADVAWLPAGSVLRPLQGAPRSASYDAIRWGVAGSRDLGLAVQWWRFTNQADADARYGKNLAGAPGAQAGSEVGARSFRAPGYQHRELCFVDAETHSVVEIGCGDLTCPGDAGATRLLELAKLIRGRLAR